MPIKDTRSAGGIVLNPNNEVLVVSQWGTSWSLPKGHIEKEEDDKTAALREIYEESGITEKDLQLVMDLGSYQRFKINEKGEEDKSERKTIAMFLFKSATAELAKVDPENPEAKWLNQEQVADLLTCKEDKEFYLVALEKIRESDEHRSEFKNPK
ncbi:MAG: NUDIX domain-containing protein [Candidatus Staskawiczbacteria bacterium]|jgi:8-oxo-dGTP pyrophosphatase MutT (NUDIX family)